MTRNHVRIDQVSSYVIDLFVQYQNNAPFLVYHNLLHTQNVVARTNEIASFYSLHETELFVVLCAAWFHDCGHLSGPAIDHELRSVLQMKEYMEHVQTDENIIRRIEACILATRLTSKPTNLLEEILCDADLYHLGTEEFYVTDMLVKREFELRNNFLPSNWNEISLALLKQHVFYTQYCRERLERGKIENINLLQDKINRKN